MAQEEDDIGVTIIGYAFFFNYFEGVCLMEKIFEPITIKKMTLKNRLIVSAMVTRMNNLDHTITGTFESYHLAKAKGGFGLIITEDYIINPMAGAYPNLPGLYDDKFIAENEMFTTKIHAAGSKIVAQIYHAGRQSCSMSVNHVPPVAPSAIKSPLNAVIPHELTIEEIKEIIRQFGEAAYRAKAAGFDGVEIHGGHGYLLHNFVSPFSNKRSDEYGGNTRNRARFSVEVVKEVRGQVGEDFPIFYRISSIEPLTGGLGIEETKAIAMLLEEAGVDVMHCSQGSDVVNIVIPSSIANKALYIDNAAEMKKVLTIPVIGVGRIDDPLIAEEILCSGKADLVNMGRASIADPELPKKTMHGEHDDINHCIGCLQGCMFNGVSAAMTCMVNPSVGREDSCQIALAEMKKQVMVVGGGISGCEVALIAAQRGHHVTLYEQSNKLGGQWLAAVVPVGKTNFASFTAWQKKQLQKYGVTIILNTAVTADLICEKAPDVVVLATGSKPIIPSAFVTDHEKVVLANEALLGKVSVGQSILVIGGGLTGAETAVFFAAHGHKVILIEMTKDIAKDGALLPKIQLMQELKKNQVEIHLETRVLEVRENGVIIEEADETKEITGIDTIILAVGVKSYNPLEAELKDFSGEIEVIGDAKAVKNGFLDIRESFELGLML